MLQRWGGVMWVVIVVVSPVAEQVMCDPDVSEVQQSAAQTLSLWLREQVPGVRSSNRAPCPTPSGGKTVRAFPLRTFH